MNFIPVNDIIKKQSQYITLIKKNYSQSRFYFLISWILSFILYGATPTDWYLYKMYTLSNIERKKIITRRKNIKIDKWFNPKIYSDTFNNKVLFNREYFHFIKRKWLYVKESSYDEIKDFISKYRKIIIKPMNSSSGRGIFIYDNNIDNINELMKTINSKDYLLEEIIENHTKIKQLNPESCNTVRLYTIINKENNIELVDAMLRVGGSINICDNFHANGVVYPIDIKTGVIKSAGKDILLNEYLYHPTTGVLMPGYIIPNWNDLKEFCILAAKQNTRARFIGWDVAITNNGFEMVEGNYYVFCGFLQIFGQGGMYNKLKKYL